MINHSRTVLAAGAVIFSISACIWHLSYNQTPVPMAVSKTPRSAMPDGHDTTLTSLHQATARQAQDRLSMELKQRALASDVEQLNRKLDRLIASVNSPAAVAMPQNADPESFDQPAEPESSPEQQRAEEEALILQMEDAFGLETQDLVWGAETQDELAAKLETNTFAGSTVIDLECRTVSCRIEAIHDGRAALDTFIAESPWTIPWDANAMTQIVDEGDGTFRSVSFYRQVLD